MTPNSKLLFVILQMSFLFIEKGNGELNHYTEPCLKNSDCTTEDHLTCIKEFCVCEPDMAWDKKDNKCKLKAGIRCISYNGMTKGPCMTNTFCDSENTKTCLCQNKDEEITISGICKKKYNSKCNLDIEEYCNPEKNLICSLERKCKCKNETEMVFREDSCKGKIGHSCDFHNFANVQLNCFENAECMPTPTNDEYHGVCACKSGFASSKDMTECIAVVGTPCSSNSDCSSGKFLSCQSSLCNCDINMSIYDPQSSKCKLRFNETCDIYEDDCYKNSWCTSTLKRCRCEKGFVSSNKDRICHLTIDAVCVNDDECNSSIGLKCLESSLELKTCQCGKEYEIFENAECKSKISFPCEESSSCVENGICLGGVCQCEENYKEFESSCVKGHNADCENNEDCISPSVHNLICGEKKCICDSSTVFDTKLDKCVVRVKGNCLDKEADCVENGFCSELSYLSRCECKVGFTPNDNYTSCLKDYGENCKKLEECNYSAQLGCFDGTCSCLPGQRVFDNEIRTCVGLVGTRCNYDENWKCEAKCFCQTTFEGFESEGTCVCEEDELGKSLMVGKSRILTAEYQKLIVILFLYQIFSY